MKPRKNSGASHNVLSLVFERVQDSARMMCGLPKYDVYVQHLKRAHPNQPIPSYKQFFCERVDARYGPGTARCC